jgi:pimeloyl-ACP methyl ester carboxylesterase
VAHVVLVHGIWNRQSKMTSEKAALLLAQSLESRLVAGLESARLSHVPVPQLTMAYYADLLANDAEVQSGGELGLDGLSQAELADVWSWLVAAGVPEPVEPQAAWLAPVRRGLGWLVRHHGGHGLPSRVLREITERLERVIVALITDMDSYTSRPAVRRAVRERVGETIRKQRPQVVVAHSMGSMVAYETLHAFPDINVELLVTLGSPLGLPALARKLEPALRLRKGARPPGVRSWVNIADAGDLVALPPELGGLYPVDVHATTDIGLLDPHTLGGYLADGVTAATIAPYLSS